MKKRIAILICVALPLLICAAMPLHIFMACNTWPTRLEDLPRNYGIKQAEKQGVYIETLGMVKNQAVMDAFLADADAGKPAFIRIMQTTMEGGAVIMDIRYDGNEFTLTVDTSRDAFAGDRSFSRVYKYMVEYTPKVIGKPLRFLCNVPEITDEIWENKGAKDFFSIP